MDSISTSNFRDQLDSILDQIASRHEPLKVTRRPGEAFVVMSAADWEREQETLHILQSRDLMQQIAKSLDTHDSRPSLADSNSSASADTERP